MITKVPAGNALRVFMQPPDGTTSIKLLRKVSDTFTGHSDPDAFVVSQTQELSVVDDGGLVNGVTYYYRAYYYNLALASWQQSNSQSMAPAYNYSDATPDVMSVVAQRIAEGLRIEIERGTLVHADGAIPVFTAPPAYGAASWPIVSVHLEDEDQSQRFLGEQMGNPEVLDDGTWEDAEGWMAGVKLAVIAWSLNSDERVELRKALRRIVMANLPVFEAHGFINIGFSQRDMEDFEHYNAPVYQSMCSFSCLAPVAITTDTGVIREVNTQVIV